MFTRFQPHKRFYSKLGKRKNYVGYDFTMTPFFIKSFYFSIMYDNQNHIESQKQTVILGNKNHRK